MKNKKLRMLIMFAAAVAVIWLAGFAVTLFVMPNRYEGQPLAETEKGQVRFINDGTSTPYLAKFDEEGNMLDCSFKVITSSDFHLESDSTSFTLDMLDELIAAEKPDLVVLLGDLILSGDTSVQEKIVDFFEEREQYWCFVPGNHDGQEYDEEDRYELRRWWYETMRGSEYCISSDEGGDEVFGFGNCAVNIRTPSGVSQTLFFMDNSVNGESGSAFDESQLIWYESRVKEIKKENGGTTVPSVIFMHRPLEEYQMAFDGIEEGTAQRIYGDINEDIEYGGKDTLMYEKAKELGSTHTFICGHEHKNDTNLLFGGIHLVYSQGLHFETYGRCDAIRYRVLYAFNKNCNWLTEGGTGFVFSPDGQTQIAPVYLPEESYIFR